jgi:hypothetical protein
MSGAMSRAMHRATRRARVTASAAAALAAAALLSGCALFEPDDGTIAVTPPPPTATAPPLPQLTALEAGACYHPAGGIDVQIVACRDPHTVEVFATHVLDSGPYPAADIEASSIATCRTDFAAFIGIEYDTSVLRLSVNYPSAGTWRLGSRALLCLVSDPDRQLTGSAQATAR